MTTQPNVSVQSNLRAVLDIFMVSFGLFFGGIVALIGLWLWFDFQANPGQSILALVSANLAAILPVWLKDYLSYEARQMDLPLTGSLYIRKQIGQRVWRRLHYLTFVAYLLGLGHGLMAGTDTWLPAIKLIYLGTGLCVLFLIYYRIFTLRVKTSKPERKGASGSYQIFLSKKAALKTCQVL